jgi:RimJ/RimL family protein N-acetyltransferase
MIDIELCIDEKTIKDILTTDGLYDIIKDDGSPSKESLKIDTSWFHLLIKRDGITIGLAQFHSINSSTLVGHINMLPKVWGQRIDEGPKKALQWIKQHTHCKKVIAFIPEECKHVLKAAERYGLKQEGFIDKSIQRNGVLMGQYVMGINLE